MLVLSTTLAPVQALRLGNYVPDFTADSTQGQIHWYDWIEGSWAVSFSQSCCELARGRSNLSTA